MGKEGLLPVTKLRLPHSCAWQALEWLQLAGRRRVEGVALWAGTLEGTTFHVQRTIIPQQTAASTEQGLYYTVGGEELRRIGLELYDAGLQLVAQIHSHPGAAYHSEMDDAYPIVTVLGGVSVVVPDFARGGLTPLTWAVYRLLPDFGWTSLSRQEKTQFVELVDDLPPQQPKRRRFFRFWPWH